MRNPTDENSTTESSDLAEALAAIANEKAAAADAAHAETTAESESKTAETIAAKPAAGPDLEALAAALAIPLPKPKAPEPAPITAEVRAKIFPIRLGDDVGTKLRQIAAEPRMRLAASLVAVLGLGLVAGLVIAAPGAPANVAMAKAPPMIIAAPDWSATSVFGRQETSDLRRLTADLRAVKNGVDSLREGSERSGKDAAARFAQLGERLERLKASDQELGARLGQLAEKIEREPRFAQIIDRIEKAEKADRGDKADRADRADRAEKTDRTPVAALPAPPMLPPQKPAEPTQTGSIAAKDAKDDKPQAQAKVPTIEGWSLLEVYDGVALIEGPDQRLYEIAPGRSLPRLGKVESIEKRGRIWVVTTKSGLIVPPGKAL